MREVDLARWAVRCWFARFLPPKPHVLLACMPKSASTFLAGTIAALPGMKQVSIAGSRAPREQELERSLLTCYHHEAYVAAQHIRYSSQTGELLEQYGLKPVVLVRNLYDATASMRDHIRQVGTAGSMAWITEKHRTLPDGDLEDLIADLVMPWYVQFFVSWTTCAAASWASYEEVRTHPAEVLQRIAKHGGIVASDTEIEDAVHRVRSKAPRFNKGVSGRGRNISPKAKEHIERLLARYPEIDFSSIA